MPVFEYTALAPDGRKRSGIVDADSPRAARLKIRGQGDFPVAVEAVAEECAAAGGKTRRRAWAVLLRRMRPAQVAVFTRQLATLLAAGFPLVAAVATLTTNAPTRPQQRVLARVKDALVEGCSFAQALTPFPGVFPPVYRNMVHAGESSGTLEIVLERLAEIMEKQQALKSRITAALAYPVLMLLVGLAVMMVLVTYIVPRITAIFDDMHQALPLPTRLLMETSEIFQAGWWALPLAAVAGVLTLRQVRRREGGRLAIDRLLLRLPLLGPVLVKLDVARITRTLATLLENGVALTVGLRIVQSMPNNALFRAAVDRACEEVAQGRDLAASLAASEVFPPLALQMIQVGEQSGQLESMLARVAQAYEAEAETTVMTATGLLEPIMIVVMGGVIGFIVLSVCLPIFEMNQLVT